MEKKAWGEALEVLDKALAQDPKQLEALFNRGRVNFELRRYPESRDDFKAAQAIQPDNPVIDANLKQAERYAEVVAPKSAATAKRKK